MKKTVYKIFGNYEKEEAWLNQMSSQGWQCVDYFLTRYRFERGKPGEYVYRIQLLENSPRHPESTSYLEFLDDMGIEVFSVYYRWVYLKKKATEGPFELYSDLDSRIKHYRLIMQFLIPIASLNFLMTVIGKNWPLNLLNLTATILLGIPSWAYHRRILELKEEQKIRE